MRTAGAGDKGEDFPSWEWCLSLAPPVPGAGAIWIQEKKAVEFNITMYLMYEVFPKTIHSWVLLNQSITEYKEGKCKVLKRGACNKRLD